MFCRLLTWIFDPINLTAISTLVIAAFTIVLACVTKNQAELTRDSIKLAREEFISTHRPQIAILVFEPIHEGIDLEKVATRVTYVNKGGTPADDIEIRGRITNTIPNQAGIWIENSLIKNRTEPLASGVKDTFLIESEFLIRDSSGIGGQMLFCIGVVCYKDVMGNRRETAFCRRFEPIMERWIKYEGADYDYAY